MTSKEQVQKFHAEDASLHRSTFVGGAFYYLLQQIRSTEGMCRQAVNTLNQGSGGPGFKPRLSCCFLRQGTILHFVSLHPGV